MAKKIQGDASEDKTISHEEVEFEDEMDAETARTVAGEMATTQIRLDTTRAEKKDTNREFNDSIKDINGHLTQLATSVQTGKRKVVVMCKVTRDFRTGEKVMERGDKKKGQHGHTVTVTMSTEEMAQPTLPTQDHDPEEHTGAAQADALQQGAAE